MLKYFITRILFFIPTLVIISLLAFLISLLAPGDPAEWNAQTQTGAGNKMLSDLRLTQKKIWRKKLGLDMPVFYLSFHSLAEPDTLSKIYPALEKQTLSRLISQYGNWLMISRYYQDIKKLEANAAIFQVNEIASTGDHSRIENMLNEIKYDCILLYGTHMPSQIAERLNRLTGIVNADERFSPLVPSVSKLVLSSREMENNPTRWKNYIPAIDFHLHNQYHRWVFGDGNWVTGEGAVFTKGIIRGDFGTSYVTGLPVMKELISPIKWSMLFAFLSIIIACLLSIPTGIYAAKYEHKWFDKLTGGVLFVFYSLPVFWIATLLLLLFANPDCLQLFPASGIMPVTGYPENSSIIKRGLLTLPFMILPLFCYIYSAVAYLSRSIRITMLDELRQDYVKTARAKGLTERSVLIKHAFKNSRLPLITLVANVFPVSIGGSLIIESIFSIPGMGLEAVSAVQQQNYPVVIAIFTITGVLSLTGYFIADMLYGLADPRISFKTVLK